MKVVVEGNKFKTPTRQELLPTHHHLQIYGYSKAIDKRSMSREHKKSLFLTLAIHYDNTPIIKYNVPLLTCNQKPSNCIITSKASLQRWKFLQHKLRGNQANKVGELLWKEAPCWISQVEEGYSLKLQQRKAWKGGTSILVIPNWAKLITRYGGIQYNGFGSITSWNGTLGF